MSIINALASHWVNVRSFPSIIPRPQGDPNHPCSWYSQSLVVFSHTTPCLVWVAKSLGQMWSYITSQMWLASWACLLAPFLLDHLFWEKENCLLVREVLWKDPVGGKLKLISVKENLRLPHECGWKPLLSCEITQPWIAAWLQSPKRFWPEPPDVSTFLTFRSCLM